MNLEISLKRVNQLLSIFVTEIKGETSMGRTDLNKASETILIPLLNEIYGWNLKNINYVEEDNNYPGIDLVDKIARVCVQVTATTGAEKVKHTLNQFIKYEQYLEYDRLVVFFLQEKKQSYPVKAIQTIVGSKFNFDIKRDIWDYRNLLKEVSSFQVGQVNRVLEILDANFGSNKPVEAGLNISWPETCQALLEQWKGLTTNTLTKSNGVRFQLDEVFVPLGVVERQKKPMHAHFSGSPEQGAELYDEKTTPISQDEFFEQVLRQGKSQYSQGKRIAIIGEPGAGKTTQLQKIGDWVLKETDGIPIWIPLSAMGTKALKDYLSQDWLQMVIPELEVSEQHRHELEQLLKTGQVWLLLDGVDEMDVADVLHHVATQMRGVWLQNIRVVLTCRLNVWEVGKNALDNFDVYRNLDFDYPTEIHQVIDKWFWEEPDLQPSLKEALEQPGKERIRDMIKNPLRLTLLCYSWQIRQGELPDTKAGLYKWFVDAFYEWNRGKFPYELTFTKRRDLNQALGDLAKAAIDQHSSRFRLNEEFVTFFLGDIDDENSLFYLALQLGWLNRIGVAEENVFENVYAFLHPTFQEYFAALAISDAHFFLNYVPEDPICSEASYRIFEQPWREVYLLWLGGSCDLDSQKTELLISLIDFEDGFGEHNFYSHRAKLIATSGISEFPSFGRSQEIINWILNLSIREEETFNNPFAYEARNFLKGISESVLADTLAEFLRSEDFRLQHDAAKLAGELKCHDSRVIDALTNLASTTKFKDTRCDALCSLLEIDPTNSTAIDGLAQILHERDEDSVLGKFAAQALRNAEIEQESVVQALGNYSQSLLIDIPHRLTVQRFLHEDLKRRLLELGINIDSGIPLIIESLVDITISSNERIQKEAAWCLELAFNELSFSIPLNIYPRLVASLKKCIESLPENEHKGRAIISVGTQDPHIACYKGLWKISTFLCYEDFYKSWNS